MIAHRLSRAVVGLTLISACRDDVTGDGSGIESEAEAESEGEGEAEAEAESETVCGDAFCDADEYCYDCADCVCGEIDCNDVLSCTEACADDKGEDEDCERDCIESGCADAQILYFEMTSCWDAATAPGGPCDSACPEESTCDQCLVLECGTKFQACLSQECPPPE